MNLTSLRDLLFSSHHAPLSSSMPSFLVLQAPVCSWLPPLTPCCPVSSPLISKTRKTRGTGQLFPLNTAVCVWESVWGERGFRVFLYVCSELWGCGLGIYENNVYPIRSDQEHTPRKTSTPHSSHTLRGIGTFLRNMFGWCVWECMFSHSNVCLSFSVSVSIYLF